jgi:hypothetical protein
VGAHDRERVRGGRLPRRRRDRVQRRRRADRDPPHHRRGLHRRRDEGLRRQRRPDPAPDGDISDDSTPAISFNAPIRWIYETLVRPDAFGAPTTKRGPLIDFFLDLQADVQESKAKVDFDRDWTDCAIIDPDCYEVQKTLTVNTVLGVRHPTVTVQECIGATIGCLISPLDVADDLIINNIGSAYMGAWIDDIQDGLEHWGELGLASTRALFDPQARRDLQNEECQFISEGTQARADCENGIGAIDVLFAESDDFIDDHLLSMLGAPDVVGQIHDLLQGSATSSTRSRGPRSTRSGSSAPSSRSSQRRRSRT